MAVKTKEKPSTAVANRKTSSVATQAKPRGRGFEESDSDTFAIPFLALLQKLSPQCDKADDLYVKGAEPGMFINTVTKELFEDGLEIIPCVYQRRFNRWAPIDSGGGFKGMFMPSGIAGMESQGVIKMSDEGRWYFAMPDGNVNEKKCDILTDTRMHFCLLVKENGTLEQVLVSLSRTQLRKSKNWMSQMDRLGGDMFSHVYSIKSLQEENDKGKWFGWGIEFSREAEPEEIAAGEQLYDNLVAGKIKAKFDKVETD